eukprot:6045784-Pleurochrysis_carterae.AAC.1
MSPVTLSAAECFDHVEKHLSHKSPRAVNSAYQSARNAENLRARVGGGGGGAGGGGRRGGGGSGDDGADGDDGDIGGGGGAQEDDEGRPRLRPRIPRPSLEPIDTDSYV